MLTVKSEASYRLGEKSNSSALTQEMRTREIAKGSSVTMIYTGKQSNLKEQDNSKAFRKHYEIKYILIFFVFMLRSCDSIKNLHYPTILPHKHRGQPKCLLSNQHLFKRKIWLVTLHVLSWTTERCQLHFLYKMLLRMLAHFKKVCYVKHL